MKRVVASGFFDPLHKGHIEYIRKAKALGDYLIVLVNTNEAAQQKKGYYFMELQERMEIIRSLKFVDEVITAKDDDGTVAVSLAEIRPDIFAKGGDRTVENLPQQELDVCKKYNIEIITGLGDKIQSSSSLMIDRLKNNVVYKQWGHYLTIYYDENIKIKLLYIQPYSSISLQKHLKRDEIWAVLKGEVLTVIGDDEKKYKEKETLFIERNILHKAANITNEILIIQEIQIGGCNLEHDIIRYDKT